MNEASDQVHSAAVEDYIKQIYKLSEQGESATTTELAERLQLGRGTVSGMLKHLAKRDLVVHRPYYGVQLSDRGHRLAMRMIRRHRLIELFLVKTLDLGWDEVDAAAERLEHAVSDELVARMDAKLGYPEFDPHGAPIPSAGGEVEQQIYRPLADLAVGQCGVVRRVSDREATFLQHLRDQGIGLDTQLEVIAIDPFGLMHVKVGEAQAHLAREAAQRVFVEVA